MRPASHLRSRAAPFAAAILLSLTPVLGGCNIVKAFSLFDHIFLDPFFPEEPIPAKFELPPGDVIVRVRAQGELENTHPNLIDLVAKRTIRELDKNVPECKFVPASHINDLRRRMATRFANLQPRELGRHLRADTLIDVQVTSFRRSSPEEGDQRLAYMELTVRVIDCKTESRLFPEQDEFGIINVKAGRFRSADERENFNKTMDEITTRAAEDVSHLFYRWRPPKPEVADPDK